MKNNNEWTSGNIFRKTQGTVFNHIRSLKLVAWLNIATQVGFPLMGAFVPAMAGSDSDNHFREKSSESAMLQTQVYILRSGETFGSVAKKYNISPEALRELNPFRTFAHGADHLQAGDRLDVPASSLTSIIRDNGKADPQLLSDNVHRDEQTQKIAGVALKTGSFLSSNAKSDAAESMALGLVSGEATKQIQQWLNKFGTARVQLGAAKNFSLKNAQFDLLLPLYEDKGGLFFTQGSLHRTDERTQANLGLGYRWFADSWMLGGNTFLDYDLSRDHARIGLGVEYRRDFLQLAANSYQRLTHWKDSRDLNNYEERPANGWDIRAQAWLPSLPQLGARMLWEQYYGSEVALFDKDSRQSNPYGITVGLSYTPVPLLTFSTDQRHGKSGANDTRFSLDTTYQLGVPWQQQLNPDAVSAMRSLAGNRYGLVERNNNIVLEYRKKNVLQLRTVDHITGYNGEQKSLGVSVTSEYGVERIDWSAESLIAAGGKIVHDNGSAYSVVLPAWQSAGQGINTYTIRGVAVDRKGNSSAPGNTQVTVREPDVNKASSTFTPVNSKLPADGKSTQVLTLTIKDNQDQPIDIPLADIKLSNGTLKSARVSALVTKAIGVNEVTVTAGQDNEAVTLTAEIYGVKLSPVTVTIGSSSSTLPDGTQSTFSAMPESIKADNQASSTLTFTARDMNGNGISGIADKLTFAVKSSVGTYAADEKISVSAITENSTPGTYTATLKGTLAKIYTITPQFDNAPMGNLSDTVELTTAAPVPDPATSGISTDKTRYTSGEDMTIKVMLEDAAGSAVTGAASSLTDETVTVKKAELKSGSHWTDNGNGIYSAIYISKGVGENLKAVLKLSGWNTSTSSEAYAITPDTQSVKAIHVNGYTFQPDEGFPSTGFIGAKFTLELLQGEASDYTWKSDAPSWVSVRDGVVSFTGAGTKNRVTITGTSHNGAKSVVWSFSLKKWFIHDSSSKDSRDWSEANDYCRTQPGYHLPMVQQLNGNTTHNIGQRGKLGALWSEWGNVDRYPDSGFLVNIGYWTSDRGNDDYHYIVSLDRGEAFAIHDSSGYHVTCGMDL